MYCSILLLIKGFKLYYYVIQYELQLTIIYKLINHHVGNQTNNIDLNVNVGVFFIVPFESNA